MSQNYIQAPITAVRAKRFVIEQPNVLGADPSYIVVDTAVPGGISLVQLERQDVATVVATVLNTFCDQKPVIPITEETFKEIYSKRQQRLDLLHALRSLTVDVDLIHVDVVFQLRGWTKITETLRYPLTQELLKQYHTVCGELLELGFQADPIPEDIARGIETLLVLENTNGPLNWDSESPVSLAPEPNPNTLSENP